MIKLVSMNYPMGTASASELVQLTDEEIDIMEYILLRRLQKFSFVEMFHSKERNVENLTELLDRGGLIHPSQEFVDVIKVMEMAFRELPSTTGDKSAYILCLEENAVPQLFKQSSDVNVVEDEQEKCYLELVALYFKVCMHRKCQHLLSNLCSQKSRSKGKKALRNSL